MSESKHTPGPWTVSAGVSERRSGFFVIAANQEPIWDDGTADGGVCIEPDARLIAAAPDLLDALSGLLAAVDELRRAARTPDADLPFGALRQAENIARAATAKATGGRP